MRKTLLALGFALLGTTAFAALPGRVAGTYRLLPNDATRSFCRRHHIDLPVGRLVLRDDGSFRMTLTDDEGTERTLGSYRVDGDRIVFHVQEGPSVGLPHSLDIDDEGLVGDAAEFHREADAEPVRRRPSRRVEERRDDPVIEERNSRPIETRPVEQPRFETRRHEGDVAGVWTLHRKAGEDVTTRFVFRKDGTFRYTGQNSSSAGRWEVTDGGIEISYLEVDGEPVERGVHMHKTLPFAFGSEAFYVDDYRYERSR